MLGHIRAADGVVPAATSAWPRNPMRRFLASERGKHRCRVTVSYSDLSRQVRKAVMFFWLPILWMTRLLSTQETVAPPRTNFRPTTLRVSIHSDRAANLSRTLVVFTPSARVM